MATILHHMKKVIFALAIAVAGMLVTSCSGPKTDNHLQEFADYINKSSKDSGLSVGFYEELNAMAVTYTVDNTPANNAKIALIGEDGELTKIFHNKAKEYLEESDILAAVVKNKMNFVYIVTTGDQSFELWFTPQEVREIAFKK